MSPGDIAMAHGDYAKAEALYADESQAASHSGNQSGPDADRAHTALIRAQLHQSKVAGAQKDALAWSAAQPNNPWALTALAEVQWREGSTDAAIQTLDKVRTIDFCNPQAHADSATLFRMLGMYASANRELTLARKLDPVDAQIELAWLRLQPPAERIIEITSLLSTATFLSAGQINALSREKQRLSQPPPTAACHLVTPTTSTSIPFRALQNGPQARTYWGLDVSFNGMARRLEIDTGASGLILSKSAANALHLEPERTFKIGGIGDEGPVDSFIAKVHSIKIGGLEFQDCYVQVLGKTVESFSAQDGLIGGNVFSSFLLTLDFPGRALKLDPLPARPGDTPDSNAPSLATGVTADFQKPQDSYRSPAMQDWDRVWRSGHDLMMDVRLSPTGPAKLFLLDTGASTDLIAPDFARQAGHVSSGSWITPVGISGKVNKTWTTGPMKLYFSHMVAPTDGMIAIDTSNLVRGSGTEISGLIGAPMLHQLTFSIDYRDNLVHFTYDPKRIAHCVDSVRIADCY
jgi:predicted aspartyl protease